MKTADSVLSGMINFIYSLNCVGKISKKFVKTINRHILSQFFVDSQNT
jgi:hypothetical protein